jgi:nucleotide-binding universal stress UspA family protein
MPRIRRILFPTDLSESSGWAYAYAARLATRFSAELYALHVRLPDGPERGGPHLPARPTDEFCLPLVEGLTETAEEVDAASAPRAIVRYAERHGVDLIVMGARGRSGHDLPDLGHVAEAVVRYASCSVLTVRGPMASEGVRRVLVPLDFSAPSRAALVQAKWVAAWFGAQIDILHVVPDRDAEPVRVEGVQARLLRFILSAPGPDVIVKIHTCGGLPASEIVVLAHRLGSDLVVIGTHGAARRAGGALGSVAEEVVRTASCPVLTVKGPVQQRHAEPVSVARPFPVAG